MAKKKARALRVSIIVDMPVASGPSEAAGIAEAYDSRAALCDFVDKFLEERFAGCDLRVEYGDKLVTVADNSVT